MRIIKANKHGVKLFGFSNGLALYGNINGTYKLEINIVPLYRNPIWKTIYVGTTKPKVRNLWLLTALTLPFTIMISILTPILVGLILYFNGGRQYITNSNEMDAHFNGKFFNIINFILMIIFAIALLSVN